MMLLYICSPHQREQHRQERIERLNSRGQVHRGGCLPIERRPRDRFLTWKVLWFDWNALAFWNLWFRRRSDMRGKVECREECFAREVSVSLLFWMCKICCKKYAKSVVWSSVRILAIIKDGNSVKTRQGWFFSPPWSDRLLNIRPFKCLRLNCNTTKNI